MKAIPGETYLQCEECGSIQMPRVRRATISRCLVQDCSGYCTIPILPCPGCQEVAELKQGKCQNCGYQIIEEARDG